MIFGPKKHSNVPSYSSRNLEGCTTASQPSVIDLSFSTQTFSFLLYSHLQMLKIDPCFHYIMPACNALLSGATAISIKSLQRVQNAAARLLTKSKQWASCRKSNFLFFLFVSMICSYSVSTPWFQGFTNVFLFFLFSKLPTEKMLRVVKSTLTKITTVQFFGMCQSICTRHNTCPYIAHTLQTHQKSQIMQLLPSRHFQNY